MIDSKTQKLAVFLLIFKLTLKTIDM